MGQIQYSEKYFDDTYENRRLVVRMHLYHNQREKWTEEEHQRFLEALRLYGRGWRQIEEHVGTKSAFKFEAMLKSSSLRLSESQMVALMVPLNQ
ncbi:Protein LHY -like protein [Gossypium arboreum]|uniref:Protein LHY-like protein n=1 Tax=Gossypium arboreum TaxID=29729 RepID=A0A0B0P5G0_GOSAR|nr:Protein LHY -like protein [Gossypium arboreum]